VNAVPEISFGTHFFQDLVETGIFYVALYPDDRNVQLNQKFFDSMPKGLKEYVPQYSKYEDVVRVLDIKKTKGLKIVSDITSQKVICYF
jgi:hypothetical protein